MFTEDLKWALLGEDVENIPMLSVEEDTDLNDVELVDGDFPLLPLRNTVLFPGVVSPITVGREMSLKAAKTAYSGDKYIAIVAQKNESTQEPGQEDLYSVGTLAKIIKRLKMPDGGITIIVQGKIRFKVRSIHKADGHYRVSTSEMPALNKLKNKEFRAVVDAVRDTSMRIVQLSPNIPSEANIALKNIERDHFLLSFVASNLNIDTLQKQRLLEMNDVLELASEILVHLNNELEMLEIKNQIHDKVRSGIDEQQRNFYLHQQLKTIQEELGQKEGGEGISNLKKKALKKSWSKTVQNWFDKEMAKLDRLNPQMPEYSVQLGYLELFTDLPWNDVSEDKIDIINSAKVLDKDHYGLDKVKDRILEYLAVLKLKGDMKSPILCFVGPPGVGKTSLGKSIAKALDRKYVRMSLGGLHDESEIRGHRRTYIGAMPGRIIQSIKKAGTSNPVIVLDEIDKVGKDFRGDPSSALLEVLDPEQNSNFHDNYLGIDYDLSQVLFIATANSLSTIQPALRDRMEIIHVSGYSVEEKVKIAQKYLVKKQRKAHGLTANQIGIPKATLVSVISAYTRESGVRSLDRNLASLMRYAAKKVASGAEDKVVVTSTELTTILGPRRFDSNRMQKQVPPGVAVGLAWTSVGGDILFIEALASKGKGGLILTGNLGDVMKESAKTALSFLRSHAGELGIDAAVFDKNTIHIHVPEGAIPKDGPSAGITMLSTLASLFTQRKVKHDLAMTGEITLRGKVLPVGGIKEKLLAAKRSGIKQIILCEQNRRHVEEIDNQYLKGLTFHYVTHMKEVLDIALEKKKVKNAVTFS